MLGVVSSERGRLSKASCQLNLKPSNVFAIEGEVMGRGCGKRDVTDICYSLQLLQLDT